MSAPLVAHAPISAPPAPPGAPSDWSTAVRGNVFSNLERLGRWIDRTALPPHNDPSGSFAPVAPGSLGAGAAPPTIYVLVHGWAPTFRSVVDQAKGDVLWWGANAAQGGKLWTSDWAWLPSSAPALTINSLGVLQSIVRQDPTAIVLAYSWLDDSATANGLDGLLDVYESEAYTHANGLRLADALEQAIAPGFWSSQTGLLRLIGHSHGSRVATVAALMLQQQGKRVAHLTILDSPEWSPTLDANGANLLGFYLSQMKIENPSYSCASGAFVDNYTSYFGVGYQGGGDIGNIVEVALQPSELFDFNDPGDQHAYAATWYGGAAAGAAAQGEPSLGLAWPPAPRQFQPALNQNWPGGPTQYAQWNLQAGTSLAYVYGYSTQPLTIAQAGPSQGRVSFDPASGTLALGAAPGGWPAYSIFAGSYANSPFGEGFGLAFDLQWGSPQPGDYLVITCEAPSGDQETLLVIDGASAVRGSASVAVTSRATGYGLAFYVYYLAAPGNTTGAVALSDFRLVEVTDPTGQLTARRIAAEEAKAQDEANTEAKSGPEIA
jgi:hypothetical protein